MMSSMHRKALTAALLTASAATIGATLAPGAAVTGVQTTPAAAGGYTPAPRPYTPPQAYAPAPAPSRIAGAVARWRALRQADNLPFSSYASFLTSYGGWPGERAMRRNAERAINPDVSSPTEVTAYFRLLPPTTPVGHARHAFALLATGDVEAGRAAAKRAWAGGSLPRTDEERLLSLFGAALTPKDHDDRIEALLANRDTAGAQRVLPLTSTGRRLVYETRIALQSKAPDAASRLAMIGTAASSDAGVLMDRYNWLRADNQSAAARALLAQRPTLTARPADAEEWFETLLTAARAAAADRNWLTAYQIASRVDDAYEPGTPVSERSTGERDDYTSLTWLAGTTALQRLNRPSEAAGMFARYARGGKSTQVLTKGLYWAGRAAQAAGQPSQANAYFSEAARHPELFYGQLALERLGLPVPAPAPAPPVAITQAERSAFERSDVVEAARWLGQSGRREDQSLFVRTIAENASNDRERALAAELGQRLFRPDLNVWVARTARNAGTPFYVRSTYPEVRVPATQSRYWSLVHGITRQESSFDRAAMSPVGARGMMQLMPATAREQAGKLGLPYDLGRLTRDPEYNIQMGSAYFERLMNYWGGSAPLAVASYNAGMGNVRKWINQYGDPRTPGVDIVNWIEQIPFSETRGYVQRVLENAVVYDTIQPGRAMTPERTRLSAYLGKSGRPG